MEFGGLNVLMISTDRNMFTPGSAVSLRMKEYGKLVEELHVIVMSDAGHRLKAMSLDKNVWLYPTGSHLKLLRPFDAARLGKQLVRGRGFTKGRSLITAQDPFECGLAGLNIKRVSRLPLEVQLHTDPFSPYFSGLLNVIRKYVAKRVIKNADTLRAVSAPLLEQVAKEFSFDKSRGSVLPIYIDRSKIENAIASFNLHERHGWRFIILTVARLSPEKNIRMALRVLSEVVKTHPDTGLVIVGDGPERSGLEDLTQELGIAGRVSFEGWQENTASYYRTADLYLQTSHFEGYGLSLVEAGLSGLPVVTTPVGIALELENNSGLVVCPQDDPESMARAVTNLFSNSQWQRGMDTGLKQALESKLISKNEYLAKVEKNWEMVASLNHI